MSETRNTTTQDGNHKKSLLSTREWIMAIVIIVMAQLLLHFWASETMDSSQVINYFSFAGTITSIILAVLAIIYSYVQNISQQNTSETISREVYKLTDVTSKVDDSVVGISSFVEQFPDFMERLNSLPDNISSMVSDRMSNFENIAVTIHKDTQTHHKELISRFDIIQSSSMHPLDSKFDNHSDKLADGTGSRITALSWLTMSIAMISVVFNKDIDDILSSNLTGKLSKDNQLKLITIMTNARGMLSVLSLIDVLSENKNENGIKAYKIIEGPSARTVSIIFIHLCANAKNYLSDASLDPDLSDILSHFIGDEMDEAAIKIKMKEIAGE